MQHFRQTLLFLLLLSSSIVVYSQEEYASISLDEALKNVKHIQRITDSQGNTVLCFQSKKTLQFVLIRSNDRISSQTFFFKREFDFVESIYDDDHFYMFYRDERKKFIHLYKTGKKTISSETLEIDTWNNGETHFSDIFYQGDFMIFSYSEPPYTIHTYRYIDGINFDKKSQSFENQKKEKRFLGRILTDQEFINIRYTMNPLTFHFYRYFGEEGFEKKSVQIQTSYDQAGVNGNRVSLRSGLSSPLSTLNAFIDGEDIYLNMEHLVRINSFKKNYKQPNKGVLKLNWDSGKSKILMSGNADNWHFQNSSVVLHDSLYFKMWVNHKRLDLSIFNIKDQRLLKTYSYSKNQDIDLIKGKPKSTSTSTVYLDLFSAIQIPISIKDKMEKEVDNKKLLKILSGENLFLEVYSDDSIIELQVSGTRFKDIFIEKTEFASFAAYLSKSSLDIVNDLDNLDDPRSEVIDDYIQNLNKKHKNLGVYEFYESAGKIYLVYTINKSQQAKIIQF